MVRRRTSTTPNKQADEVSPLVRRSKLEEAFNKVRDKALGTVENQLADALKKEWFTGRDSLQCVVKISGLDEAVANNLRGHVLGKKDFYKDQFASRLEGFKIKDIAANPNQSAVYKTSRLLEFVVTILTDEVQEDSSASQ